MRSLVPALLLLAFTVYCVVDVVRSDGEDVRGLPKPLWVLLCLLFPLVGGIAWFVAGRPRNRSLPGTDRLRRPRPTVLGPDDDPDFLRTIDRPGPVAPAAPLDTPAAGPTGSSAPTVGGPVPGDRAGDGTGDSAGADPRAVDPVEDPGHDGTDAPDPGDRRP